MKETLATAPSRSQDATNNNFVLTGLKEKLDDMCKEITGLANYNLIDETNQLKIEEEAYKIRRTFTVWKRLLNQRKQNFWNCLKTRNISNLYDQYLADEDKFLPRKFRPHHIPQEPQDQQEERIRVAFETMRAEQRILLSKSEKFKSKFQEVDDDMLQKIGTRSSSKIQEKLQELWRKECQMEEEKSEKIWEKKAAWFEQQREKELTNNQGKFVLLKSKKEIEPQSWVTVVKKGPKAKQAPQNVRQTFPKPRGHFQTSPPNNRGQFKNKTTMAHGRGTQGQQNNQNRPQNRRVTGKMLPKKYQAAHAQLRPAYRPNQSKSRQQQYSNIRVKKSNLQSNEKREVHFLEDSQKFRNMKRKLQR